MVVHELPEELSLQGSATTTRTQEPANQTTPVTCESSLTTSCRFQHIAAAVLPWFVSSPTGTLDLCGPGTSPLMQSPSRGCTDV